ncbi:MAG TPA: SRPBCC domain-containing protein [Ilumatobacter sp.]
MDTTVAGISLIRQFHASTSLAVLEPNPPHALEFEDGFADGGGRPNDDLPTTSIEVRLTAATAAKTRMTMTSRFASIDDMERIIATGSDEGMALAVGQIDTVLAAPSRP